MVRLLRLCSDMYSRYVGSVFAARWRNGTVWLRLCNPQGLREMAEITKEVGPRPVFDEVATFVRVVRSGTLAGAARELGVPKSTVSRRLVRLESSLGVKLLHRGARSFSLTTEGERLFDSVQASIGQVEVALHTAVHGGTLPQGPIRISAPEDFGRLVLLDQLQNFANSWPDISLDIDLSNRFVDVVREGFDLVVRASGGRDLGPGSLIHRKLFDSELHLACSGKRSEVASTLGELAQRPFVLFRQTQHEQELELRDRGGRTHRLQVRGRFIVHDYGSMARLVAQGQGYGLLPRIHIEHSQGALRRVMPELHAVSGHVALVYPSRHLPRRVSLLIEHLTACYSQ